ncbi:MAG TPA: UDP-N-acetylglucosamine 1-carboxyvinyltransferase, partial [Myxococcota bacterium]|nr:UDP-N-acetylglucosamine 1-carboxyvinyltransferase [Myxococcota bacterium]
MGRFIIEGGNRISGTMTPSGNKNEALPALAACLLTDQEVVLRNMPRLRDVEVMIEVLESLGGEIRWLEHNVLSVRMKEVRTHRLDPELCRRVRASVLFSGPMTARCRRVELPPPGGDVIGRRRLDTLFDALGALGAEISVGEHYQIDGSRLHGAEMFLDEASVT